MERGKVIDLTTPGAAYEPADLGSMTQAELVTEVRHLRGTIGALGRLLYRLMLVLPPPPAAADEISAQEASKLVNVDAQTVRNWCRSAGIGNFDRDAMRWIVSRQRLLEHVHRRRLALKKCTVTDARGSGHS